MRPPPAPLSGRASPPPHLLLLSNSSLAPSLPTVAAACRMPPAAAAAARSVSVSVSTAVDAPTAAAAEPARGDAAPAPAAPPRRRLILLRHGESAAGGRLTRGRSRSCVAIIDMVLPPMDGQTAEHLQKAICQYSSDEILTVMCMGHNKGWEEAASMFSGDSVVLKTCNAALLEAEGKSWVELNLTAGYILRAVIEPPLKCSSVVLASCNSGPKRQFRNPTITYNI
uniref:Uncharacterized protein n=1 Tax=Oryza sativa subsp. japonica TaxID=39947 RepID=Q6EN62_ORYSJ|nr:hypothetical protein [Oryza sativa Japonica Group]BAD29673.1 hypothetical protein [Oryza sativa Japonica Group]